MVILLLICAACGSESGVNNDGWSFDEDGGLPPRACSDGPEVTTYQLGGAVEQMWSSSAPSITDGRVYFHRPVDGTIQLFAEPIGRGESRQLTDGADGSFLQIANDGGVISQNWLSSETELEVRDLDGHLLNRIVEIGVLGVRPVRYTGGAVSSFDGDRFLTSALHLLDVDGEILFSYTERSSRGTHRAVLAEDGFYYTAGHDERDPDKPGEVGPGDVFEWTPEAGRERLIETPQDERHVWVDGRDLYWVTDEAVHKMTRGGQIERIHEGRCGPVHALGGTAVFGCSDPRSGTQVFDDVDEQLHDVLGSEPVATQLFLYDGRRTRRLELDSERELIHSVRISPSGIAWFEFDDADAFCRGAEMGRVMYRGWATQNMVQVGEVQAPCWCCDLRRTALVLEVADGVVAWNYAQPWETRPPDTDYYWHTSGYAYATIEPPEACEEN